jgi:hypothetical protein
MENQNTEKTVVFLDNVGRTIIGLQQSENEKTLVVKNPALVHISTNPQTNQLSLQIFPLFFKEFQANRSEATVWSFNKDAITVSEPINLAPQFIAQYQQLFQLLENGTPSVPNPQKEPEVVKLFDEESTENK